MLLLRFDSEHRNNIRDKNDGSSYRCSCIRNRLSTHAAAMATTPVVNAACRCEHSAFWGSEPQGFGILVSETWGSGCRGEAQVEVSGILGLGFGNLGGLGF